MHAGHFRHELFEYTEGADGFVEQTLPHVSRALAAQEPILVVVASENVAALKEALGDDAELAFDGGQPWHLLCPYDVDGLDDQVIEAAQHSHPFVAPSEVGDERAAADPPRAGEPRPFEGELPAPLSAEVHELQFTAEQLASLRHFLSQWSARQLLSSDATEELVLAVNELATNSIRYGGGSGTMLAWRERDVLMCEIKDAGYIEDPLIGHSRPAPEQHTGRGLWLVNQLCDLVQIRSSPSGTAIRVHKARDLQP